MALFGTRALKIEVKRPILAEKGLTFIKVKKLTFFKKWKLFALLVGFSSGPRLGLRPWPARAGKGFALHKCGGIRKELRKLKSNYSFYNFFKKVGIYLASFCKKRQKLAKVCSNFLTPKMMHIFTWRIEVASFWRIFTKEASRLLGGAPSCGKFPV